ncbi:hypothetical protein CVT26_001604 [Gymnopilus dilepis]|uniref:Uncharacterized protein n=1 Tax=Gymnopilus dilepis TaxID=231916 RepID=A0A409VSR9_9AGAR|nr:hypothetical protein CVT26_001604 [Gymnopilus dilepis]
MQTPNNSNVRGYSDFFTSGFRAVTSRRPSTTRNALEQVDGSNPWLSKPLEQRKRRPTSMMVSSSTTPTMPRQNSRERSKGRRSSFISFSSRLFDRIVPTSSWDDSSSTSRRSSRSSGFFRSSEDSSKGEVWISAGGPSAPNGRSLPKPIDPFSSSPNASSMFIDLSSSDGTPSRSGTPKRESFLSLTGSSRSSLHFTTRRERPTSIHTMPLPSRSRRSSLQYPLGRNPSHEKSDFFLILEEEPSATNETILEDHDEWDAPAKIDWRQFHIDILTDVTQ